MATKKRGAPLKFPTPDDISDAKPNVFWDRESILNYYKQEEPNKKAPSKISKTLRNWVLKRAVDEGWKGRVSFAYYWPRKDYAGAFFSKHPNRSFKIIFKRKVQP